MKAIIVEKMKSDYFAQSKEIANVLGENILEFNWLISNYELNHHPSTDWPIGRDYVWLEGKKMKEIFDEYDFQIIWGVMMGFSKEVSLDDVLEHPIPFAEGNEDFWRVDRELLHPMGTVEITSFDASLLVVVSNIDSIVEDFEKEYPDSKIFREYLYRK